MNKERAITYSLLTHIRNTGTLVRGPIDIFIPLIKRVLAKMNLAGVFKGESLLEIKEVADKLYSIDFPIPVLKKILSEICKEINTEEITYFYLYQDGSFSLNKYTFTEYENTIDFQKNEIEKIEKLFKEFCESSDFEVKQSSSIFKFIEKNKFNLSQYLSYNAPKNGVEYTAEAQFVDFFKKIPEIYNRIKDIYLGSIIAGYIEYNSDDAKIDIELLLDTNFIVGLIDLNTAESTHTCNTLIKIAKQQNYKIRVLKDTIEETTHLLEAKSLHYDKSFLQKKVNQEDIYNACDRRNLNKSDLERITDNLEASISSYGISVLYDTSKLKNEAKFTEEYKSLLKVRNSKVAALHDAIAILYIKKQRKQNIKDFDKVNSWFVNNSISIDGFNIHTFNGYQPESIKADDLLNILWLSNPQINKAIESDDLAEIGLTSSISLTLNSNLPRNKILRELDDNIHKYAKEVISDTDILRVATRITNKQLQDIEGLNSLADKDKIAFVKRLEEEADKQKRLEEIRIEKFKKVFKEISIQNEELLKIKEEFTTKNNNFKQIKSEEELLSAKIANLQNELLQEKNKNREILRTNWIDNQVSNWRKKSWIEFSIFIIVFLSSIAYILYQTNWDINNAVKYYKTLDTNVIFSGLTTIFGFIFMSVTLKTLYDKYRNHSNIQNYVKGLKTSKDYNEIK